MNGKDAASVTLSWNEENNPAREVAVLGGIYAEHW